MSPDAIAVRAFLARASRRLTWIAVFEGAAAGLAIALVVALAAASAQWRSASSDHTLVISLSLAALGIAIGAAFVLMRPRRVARLVERHAPQCRNVVVTAAELIDQPMRVRPYIRDLVCREAARAVEPLDPAALFPARRAMISLGVTVVLWAAVLLFIVVHPTGSSALRSEPGSILSAVINGVEVTITPPAYAQSPTRPLAHSPTTLRDPSRVVALAGSRIRLAVRADAGAVTIETIGDVRPLDRGESRTFTGEVVADADGYMAISPVASDGRPGVRRLIGLTVTADHSPRIKVTAPARDLFVPDAKRTIDVTIEANDDLGLASLHLRYTKVSGSGEQFRFTDGEAPLNIVRGGDQRWTGRGALRLDALGLEAGDLVVYRGVATDHRPGVPASESDAFIVEITAPGAVAAEGFSADDDDKYALSQQMVVLKTERLIARARSLPADSLTREALTIAAEQRAVRAEFVFMMGGELAEEVLAAAGITDLNETAEAEAEEDIAAGRLANRGRTALVQAIRSMSRANSALNATDLTKALAEEKAALTYLQRAFSRTRYILRALTQRERLDLSRRLTGELGAASVGRDGRPTVEPEMRPRINALRRALSEVAVLAAQPASANAAARASLLAQNVLQVDPSAVPLQQVAAQLNEAAGAMAGGRTSVVTGLLDRAATQLTAALRAELVNSPHRGSSFDANRLEGALADALRSAKDRR